MIPISFTVKTEYRLDIYSRSVWTQSRVQTEHAYGSCYRGPKAEPGEDCRSREFRIDKTNAGPEDEIDETRRSTP